jgi:hypothetical protein
MWRRILAAWALYRHGVALKGLLQSLGIWGYVIPIGAAVLAAILAPFISLPVWGQILFGLGAFALFLFCVGFAVAVKRVAISPSSDGVVYVLTSGVNKTFRDKLKIEVLDGLVGHVHENIFAHGDSWILLKCSLVNTRDPPVAIKNFDLELRTCPDGQERLLTSRQPIPDGFAFTSLLGIPIPTIPPPQTVSDRLDEKMEISALAFGIPAKGWILFRCQKAPCYLFGMIFKLLVTDVLDGESTCTLYPGEWLRLARFYWPEPPPVKP